MCYIYFQKDLKKMKKLNRWFISAALLVLLDISLIALAWHLEYPTVKAVYSTVVLPDGTSIVCPDPNYNPHYMDGAVTVTYDFASGLTATTIGTETPVFPEPVTVAKIIHMER